MLLDMLQLLYLQTADWTSSYLVIWHAGSTAFLFYSKRGLKIQSSSASRHVHSISFLFLFHEEWVENSTLPLILDTLDTLTVFHFLPRAEYLTCRLDSIFFFFFTQKRGLEKSRPLLPVNLYLEFRFFFLKSELKIQLFFYQSIRWPLFNLSQERIEKSSFTRVFFALRYVDRLLLPQSGWKRSSLTQLFPLFETKTCCLFFFAILHVFSCGPCLVFGFHTLCLVP